MTSASRPASQSPAQDLFFLTVVIPAYNEGSQIEQAVRKTAEYLSEQRYRWEILVVDDGSRDDTDFRLRRLKMDVPELRWVTHPENLGKGAAVRSGFKHAQGEAVLFCDADGATPIETVEAFLPHLRRGADVVVGSRQIEGAKIQIKQPAFRRFLSGGYRWLCQKLATPGISDVTCGFKVVSRRSAQRFAEQMQIAGWSFDAELFVIAQLNGFKIIEVPVRWTDHRNSKVQLGRDVWGSFRELVQILVNRKQGRYRAKR